MQELIVFILVLAAGLYVFWRMKELLTVGEENRKCAHCPINAMKFKTPPK
jgi:hypothetical protein